MRIYTVLIISAALCMGSASTLVAQRGHGFGHMGHPISTSHPAAHQPKGAGMQHQSGATSRLAQNPALASQLQKLLPAGTNLQTAASGFKNLGQFVAAVHVAHNLHIPFAQLKAKMTGPDSESLGRAIQDLRPNLSRKTIKSDVKTANAEAKEDIEQTEQKEAQSRDREQDKD